jgi:hypothetical protein
MTQSAIFRLIARPERHKTSILLAGAIAQLGERVNGIHEVGGSIPPGSTKFPNNFTEMRNSHAAGNVGLA